MSSSEIREKLRRRIVKNFMSILVLTRIKKHSLSGYDVMRLIHKRFDTMLSPGTIYNMLYSLERDGLIEGTKSERKRSYRLTEQGERSLEVMAEANNKIQEFIRAHISS